jgi:hypothetical protein
MFLAESLDELLVHGLVTVVGEDTEKGLSLVKSLGRLVKATGKAVVDEGGLQNLLISVLLNFSFFVTDGGAG